MTLNLDDSLEHFGLSNKCLQQRDFRPTHEWSFNDMLCIFNCVFNEHLISFWMISSNMFVVPKARTIGRTFFSQFSMCRPWDPLILWKKRWKERFSQADFQGRCHVQRWDDLVRWFWQLLYVGIPRFFLRLYRTLVLLKTFGSYISWSGKKNPRPKKMGVNTKVHERIPGAGPSPTFLTISETIPDKWQLVIYRETNQSTS